MGRVDGEGADATRGPGPPDDAGPRWSSSTPRPAESGSDTPRRAPTAACFDPLDSLLPRLAPPLVLRRRSGSTLRRNTSPAIAHSPLPPPSRSRSDAALGPPRSVFLGGRPLGPGLTFPLASATSPEGVGSQWTCSPVGEWLLGGGGKGLLDPLKVGHLTPGTPRKAPDLPPKGVRNPSPHRPLTLHPLSLKLSVSDPDLRGRK